MKNEKPSKNEEFVLGFDGGGTKSICVIAKSDGTVVGIGHSGITNFQGAGFVHAEQQVGIAIEAAIKQAKIMPEQITYATYGVAGADRDDDFDTVASYIAPSNPSGNFMLTNDTTIALRAGTSNGVGVALICGTGSNCIGFDADYNQAKVGGLGRMTGDAGSGEDVVERAITAAMRMIDGRGPKTMLHDRLAKELDIEELVDIITFSYADNFSPVDVGKLAPVVFDCAKKGDKVAIKVLTKIGDELAENAVTACKRLFKKDDKIKVVLGGSILQKSKPAIFKDRIVLGLSKKFPNAKVHKLKDDPVLGAVFFSLDQMHVKAGRQRMAQARKTYRDLSAKNGKK